MNSEFYQPLLIYIIGHDIGREPLVKSKEGMLNLLFSSGCAVRDMLIGFQNGKLDLMEEELPVEPVACFRLWLI